MASLNSVTLIGRVVGPPELRYTPGGKAVAQFTLAVDRRVSKGSEKECDFIPIVAWEKLAEICNQYLSKGKPIAVQGGLRTRKYETQDGQKRTAFEVVIHEMQMLSTGEGGGQGQGQGVNNQAGMSRNGENPRPAAKSPSGWGSTGFGADDLSVDEIPF